MDADANLIDPALSSNSSQTMPPHQLDLHDEDDDPVVATYNILLKPTLSAHRKVMILEHPNKSDGKKHPRAPLELRMKPATGMVEVDYPLDYNNFYDRNKGLTWGTNLHKSLEAKKGGTHGLAGGFGVGAPPPRGRAGRAAAADEILDLGMDWAEALRKDYVLRTQTLGGQTPDADMESKYMVGVFAGGNIHLTPATSLVHLRPQHHHIDATTDQERRSAPPPPAAASATAASKDAARAIHMTIKQTTSGGDEEIVQETMADRLKKVQMETWHRLRYMHDEAADSWVVAEEALYLEGPPGSNAEGKAAGEGEGDGSVAAGKQPEAAAQAHGVADLVNRVQSLQTAWDEDSMLETMSGISKESMIKLESPDDGSTKPAAASGRGKGKGKAVDPGTSSAGRSKTAATASKATTTRGKNPAATTSNAKRASQG